MRPCTDRSREARPVQGGQASTGRPSQYREAHPRHTRPRHTGPCTAPLLTAVPVLHAAHDQIDGFEVSKVDGWDEPSQGGRVSQGERTARNDGPRPDWWTETRLMDRDQIDRGQIDRGQIDRSLHVDIDCISALFLDETSILNQTARSRD